MKLRAPSLLLQVTTAQYDNARTGATTKEKTPTTVPVAGAHFG